MKKEYMEKKWIYFGVFLDSISKAKNLSALETNGIVIPNDWKRFNHHMTIAFNDGSKEVYDLYKYYQIYLENPSMETDITLTINGIGVSDDAIALRVDWGFQLPTKHHILQWRLHRQASPLIVIKLRNGLILSHIQLRA